MNKYYEKPQSRKTNKNLTSQGSPDEWTSKIVIKI